MGDVGRHGLGSDCSPKLARGGGFSDSGDVTHVPYRETERTSENPLQSDNLLVSCLTV